MAFEIKYKGSVEKDLRRLDKKEALRIINKLEKELRAGVHKSGALKGEFSGLFRIRVGDYRVIYTEIEGGFLVLRIGHRKDVYR